MGCTYDQFIELSKIPFNNSKKFDRLFPVVQDVMVKLQALKYHLSNYENKEKSHIDHIAVKYESFPNVTHSAYDLLFELEAFLFQFKSTLDISVKIIEVLLPKRFKTHTFGKKGELLIKGLNNYLNDKAARKDTVSRLVKMLEYDKTSWLEQIINLRDTISHYKTFNDYNYHAKIINDNLEIIKPLLPGIEVEAYEYMQISYYNCLDFVRDFISLSIELILPPSVYIDLIDTYHAGPQPIDHLKYGLYFRNNKPPQE